jgi:hypothetical protein
MLKKILLAAVVMGLVLTPVAMVDALAINNPNNTFADTSFYDIVNNVANFVFGFIVILSIIFLVWGGIQYVTAGGDEAQMEKAKSTITYAIIGLFVAGVAFAIVNLVLQGIINGVGI